MSVCLSVGPSVNRVDCDNREERSVQIFILNDHHASCMIFHCRVYVETIDRNVQKLYITHIEEGDAGVYSCRAVINNEERWKNLTLTLFRKY